MKTADCQWIYVRLPVSIQEKLQLLELREKAKERPHRWPVPPKKSTVDVKPKAGIVGAKKQGFPSVI